MLRPQALLTSDSGLLGQSVRFVLVGGFVALVYLLTTTFLAVVIGVPFEVALLVGFCLGLTIHFSLQRVFVWGHDGGFALPFRRQAARYIMVAGTQYLLTALGTALLPRALGLPTEVVYLAIALLCTGFNFVIFRGRVFHARVQ